jgi:hypothetical protein
MKHGVMMPAVDPRLIAMNMEHNMKNLMKNIYRLDKQTLAA